MSNADADLIYQSATDLAARIRSKDLAPTELMDAVFSRIHDVEPEVHAFSTRNEDNARQAAQRAEDAVMKGEEIGPLHGLPVSVKDLMVTAGLRTTFGSKLFENNVPDFDTVGVERLKAAGAIVIGKTNTPHFGYKDMSDNLVTEAARNPWNTNLTAGGSSGGAAAAVASGMGPLAIGSDGGGSIRIPAALCGVFGYKPSYGRIPQWPSGDFWAGKSHDGPITRTVRDAALMLGAIAGPDPRDPISIDSDPIDYVAACTDSLKGLRVAWSPDLGLAHIDPEVLATTEAAARRFSDFGCHVEEVNPGLEDPGDWNRTLWRATYFASRGKALEEHPEWFEPGFAESMELGRNITATEFVQAQLARSRYYDRAREFMDNYDILLTPSMPCVAWPYSELPGPINGHEVQRLDGGRWVLMYPFNHIGWPASSVPCGFNSEGLPIGLQIVTHWHQDALCFAASAAFEAAQPWADPKPSL